MILRYHLLFLHIELNSWRSLSFKRWLLQYGVFKRFAWRWFLWFGMNDSRLQIRHRSNVCESIRHSFRLFWNLQWLLVRMRIIRVNVRLGWRWILLWWSVQKSSMWLRSWRLRWCLQLWVQYLHARWRKLWCSV